MNHSKTCLALSKHLQVPCVCVCLYTCTCCDENIVFLIFCFSHNILWCNILVAFARRICKRERMGKGKNYHLVCLIFLPSKCFHFLPGISLYFLSPRPWQVKGLGIFVPILVVNINHHLVSAQGSSPQMLLHLCLLDTHSFSKWVFCQYISYILKLLYFVLCQYSGYLICM